MSFKMLSCLVSLIIASFSLQAQVSMGKQSAKRMVLEDSWIIGGETIEQWKGLLPLVNSPYRRTRAFPGQTLTLAVWSKGDGRDELLKDGTYSFTVEYSGATTSFNGLRPAQVRQIKNEGADFVKYVMAGAQIKEDVSAALSVASVALFDLSWTIPPDAKEGFAKVQGKATFKDGTETVFKDQALPIWSYDRVSKEGGTCQRL